MEGIGDALDVVVAEYPVAAGYHRTEVAGIDEKDFFLAVFEVVILAVAGDEPEAGEDSGVVEELVNQFRLDDGLADVTLAAAVGRRRTVGQHQPQGAVEGEMVDHVLHPGEVGVAGGALHIASAGRRAAARRTSGSR